MTIKDLFSNRQVINLPTELQSRFSFFNNYNMFHVKHDKLFLLKKGSLSLDTELEDDNISITRQNVDDIIIATLLAKEQSLNHLFDALSIEYDPISNYDKQSTITTTLGATRQEDIFAEKEIDTTNINGDRTSTTTNNLGEKITDNTNDLAKVEVMNKTTGYNYDEFGNDNSSETITQPTATHIKEHATTDSQAIVNDGYTDTQNITENARTDVHTTDEVTNKVVEQTKGNIGVKTAGEILENDLRFWKTIDFYEYLYNIITESIAYGFY